MITGMITYVVTRETLATVINKPITIEAITKPIFVNIISKFDLWIMISAIGSLLLGISVLATGTAWIWEHLFRNYFCRYKLDIGHNQEWIKDNILSIVDEFKKKTAFRSGALYSFKIINKGTTHDYIYKAELDNGKRCKINISTSCILTGTNYNNENLPHALNSLQGEVWFVAAKNKDFKNIIKPKLIIYTAAKKYSLKMTEGMFIISAE